MPKSLVIGNGNVLVGFDRYGQLKDFYFPYVGLEDQIGGFGTNKIGVFIDNRLSWLSDAGWEITIDYQKETLASDIRAVHAQHEIEIRFLDAVYNERDVFLKRVTVVNRAARTRQIKVFFNQQFQFYESNRANTAYYNPDLKAMVHYKGRRVVVVAGDLDGNSFDDYAAGLLGIEGKSGTFVDAEDGILSKNPIEYGSVDSTIGFTLMLDGEAEKTFHYWFTVSRTLKEAKDLHLLVLQKRPEYMLETTQNFWRAWANKSNFTFYRLDDTIVNLFKKSLLIIRTHVDNRGGILASGDIDMLQYGRDTYGYMWPRDAALIAMAMDRAGYSDLTKRFFEFCNEVIDENGYLFHKYRIDKSLGSSWHPWMRDGQPYLPIQEDETALVMYALWHHYTVSKDLEFIESIYNSFIKRAAEFMADFREPKTRLPKATYDLWEEKSGISTFTAAATMAALQTAANFAKLLGKETSRKKYATAAAEIREAILTHLYSKEEKIFYKLINIKNGHPEIDTTIDVSSLYGLFAFGVLEPDDQRLVDFAKIIEDVLVCHTETGGVVRYLGDNYYRVDPNTPGNPWILTTLWLAQYRLARATREADVDRVRETLQWVAARASPAGILSEQVNPHTGEPISVAPLIWSHAEFVTTVMQYMQKLDELGIAKIYQRSSS